MHGKWVPRFRVQGFKGSRQGFEVRGALRFRFEAKKDRTILASSLIPHTSILQTTRNPERRTRNLSFF